MTSPTERPDSARPAIGDRPMRRPAMKAALTAIGLVLSATMPTTAQVSMDQPIDLTGMGTGATITTPGNDAQAGYFVAPDGSIQYRDASDMMTSSPGSIEAIVASPMPADIFDAAPVQTETVTLESLQNVFATDSVSVDANASMGIEPGYRLENGTIVLDEPFATAPMLATPTATTFEATPPPMMVDSVPFDGAMPMMAAPMIPTEPLYYEPAPVSISTLPQETVIDNYASLEPAPLMRSGSDFAMDGDGAFGPSTFKRTGEGPAGQNEAIYVGKSTIVELPVEAHEILVADPTRVRAILRTARQIVLIGLQPGQTSITVFDDKGKQVLSLDGNIRFDLRPLRQALATTFPGLPVEIDTVLGDVVVRGAVPSASEAEAVRNLIRRYLFTASQSAGVATSIEQIAFIDQISLTSEEQILVKVRIAEMRRSVVKQFGVDFNLASDAALSAATGGLAQNLTDFGSITNAFGVNGAALGGIAANIAGSFESTNFGALVRAFERHNVMRVLAEPTLTAVSGETASFLAGGQFPFPTSVEDGNIGFSFRDFGVALEFTPVVVGDGRISLTVATEISELTTEGSLNAGNISIPGISVRKANTTVELPSGGTMSIAGMLLQRDANAHTGLPGLKNLPVLGQLFSSTDYQKQETELVILVTPYIVKPGQEKDFRLPTDGFAPASDFDLFVLGRLHKVYGTGETETSNPHTASAKEALKAPFGFILE